MTQKQHNNDEHSDLRKKKPLLSYVDVYVEASYVIIKITTLYRNVVNSLVWKKNGKAPDSCEGKQFFVNPV